MERRVTVFGGSGFVGRYVVKRLAAQGAVVRAAVRDVERAKFLRPMGLVGQVVPFPCDLASEASVRRAVENTTEVVNLVGILQESGRQSFGAIQARGPGLIGEAAAAAGVERVVHVSAIGADPEAEARYQRSKGQGERALRAAFPNATILQPSIVFGPEDRFFNRFAAMARISPVLPLIHGGRTRFQPVYVGDVAEAVVRALADPATRGRTYELGGPGVYTFRELLSFMLREIGRSRLLLPLPTPVARMQAAIMEMLLPSAPLTRDQILMLEHDNVVTAGAAGFAELGIQPEAMEGIVPAYLRRFRPGGGVRTLAA